MRARISPSHAFAARIALLLLACLGIAVAAANATSRRVEISGAVTAVDTAAGTLTIAPRRGDAVTLKTDANTRLSLDEVAVSLAEIPTGAKVQATYDPKTLTAVRVEARSLHPLAVVEGTVSKTGTDSITIAPEEGADVTLTVNAATHIFLDGKASTLAALAAGDSSSALYDRATHVAIVVQARSAGHEQSEVEGMVTAVGASSITITPESGAPVMLGIDASTHIVLNGAASTLSALAAGDEARALYDSATKLAAVVQAQSRDHELAEVEGTVTSVSKSSVTITPAHGTAVTLTTSATTQIFVDGSISNLSSVKVGDEARALYDSATMIAAVLQAHSRHNEPQRAVVEGTVTAVTASSITIQPRHGTAVALATDASTRIFRNGRSATLASITVGDQAGALYDSTTMTALAIEARSSSQGDD
jgi:preprotein translocase subunit YajC